MSRKSWTTARRSLFKRRKGGRSSSRDQASSKGESKELASYSDVASLACYADNIEQPDNPVINSYVRVERLDCKFPITKL